MLKKKRPQRKKDDLQAGGEPIYFNDPKILKKYHKKDYLEEIRLNVSKWDWNRKPRKLGGHDNHIHVCFPKNSKDARKACKSGL